jgi:ribonucleoside-triphosphate reductase
MTIDEELVFLKGKLNSGNLGTECSVYARITGYYRPVSAWNKGKKSEFNDRKNFVVEGV